MDRQNSHIATRLIKLTAIVFLILLSSISFAEEEESPFLPADKAFILNAKLLENNKILVNFDIAPGYQLYQEHLKFQLKTPEEIKNIPVTLPAAITKKDPVLGDYKVYTQNLNLNIPIPASSLPALLVTYQGCSEEGFCYAPQTKQIHFSETDIAQITGLDTSPITPTKTSPSAPNSSPATGAETEAGSDHFTELLQNKSIPITLLMFFGLGLLLAFTPCVLPMIPIMANILVGAEKPLASRRAIFLASLYVLSVAVCYACAGVIAGLVGNRWQMTLQQPPFLISLSILLILFALSQFNLISIRAPQILSNSLHQLERRQKHGSALGAVGMGVISALMASPCVTPALIGALTYISQTGNSLLGGLALFMMSLGMGFPLLGVACLGSRFLPKAGSWMVAVKNVTGILLLVLAGSIIMRVIPDNTWNHLFKNNQKIEFVTIQNINELHQGLTTAKNENKPVILDVYAKWCISCQRMDHAIFEDPETKKLMTNYHLLRLDITEITEETEKLLKKLAIIGPPTVLFFNPTGQEVTKFRVVGEVEKSNFHSHIARFDKHSNLSQSTSNH